MKLVQDSMDDRREHDAHDSYEHQTTKKRIAGSKEFGPVGFEMVHGAHAAQNH